MVHDPHKMSDLQERLHLIRDDNSDICGVIAIHSTALGPAAGGCRLWHYASDQNMIEDAVRLARGMSYKNALAGLPFGGGKAVLRKPDEPFDRTALFRLFGRSVEELQGEYITAEDVGTGISDMRTVRQQTYYVAGLEQHGGRAGGDPSPWTSLGVFEAMKIAARIRFGSDLKGLRVAVQGVGNVGAGLCRLLHRAGAKLIIADIDTEKAAALAEELGAHHLNVDEILRVDAEIFAPCALGAVLNEKTIPTLRVGLICGAANNQLATEADGEALMQRAISYAPDYVVNAGGIINVAAEYLGESDDQVENRVLQIGNRLARILQIAADEHTPPHVVADRMAQQIIAERRMAAAS